MNHISIRYEDSVAVVTYDRGEKKNAMSMQIIRDLTATAEALKAIATTSRAWCSAVAARRSAPVDLTDPERFDLAGKSLSEQRQIPTLGTRMCRAEELPQITVAAIERHECGRWRGADARLRLARDGRRRVSVRARGPDRDQPEWNAIPRLVNMVGASMAKQIV